MKVLLLLLRYKYFILSIVLLVTGFTIYTALHIKNQFASTATAVPPRVANSYEGFSGGTAALLREMGISQLVGKTEATYSFLVILRSRSLKDSVINKFNLKSAFQLEDTSYSAVLRELEDRYEISIEKAGNYLITAWDTDPVRAAEISNYIITCANNLSVSLLRPELYANRVYLETRYKQIDNEIIALSDSMNRITGSSLIFSPLDQAKSFSSVFSEMKSKEMENEILLNLYRSSYGVNDPNTKMQENLLSEIKQKLVDIESKSGVIGNSNIKDASRISMNYLKLYSLYEANIKLKAAMIPIIEKSKIDEQRFVPSLYMIDSGRPSDKKDRPKRSIMVVGAFFGSLVFAIVLVVVIDALIALFRLIKTEKQKDSLSNNQSSDNA